MKLNADFTQRASCNINSIQWESSPSAGVDRKRIECDDNTPPVERVTTIVRFAPGSSFSGHVHGGGEEFLVLEGTFSDQHADYPAGYYVRNPKGTGHAPHSHDGCTILVKLWQMHPQDKQQFSVNTRDESLWIQQADNSEMLPLFNNDYETVCMLKWSAGLQLNNLHFASGVEYFLIEGTFSDQQGIYTAGSWLRLPAGAAQNITVKENCLLFRKSNHLLNPVDYLLLEGSPKLAHKS